MTASPMETAGSEVLIERHDNIAHVVLNRAAQSNPISWSLGGNLLAALDELEDDKHISGIVLTGAGSNFCAGAKLGEVINPDGVDIEDQYYGFRDIVRAVSRIRSHELPIVCALNGGAVGGGAALALACDLVVAADRAFCLFAFGRMGASAADLGCTYILQRLVGVTRARHLLLTGARVEAREGKEYGMFLDVVENDNLMEAATALARQIVASAPRHALTATKQVMMRAETTDFETCLFYERFLQSYFLNGPDHKERLNRFLSSRPRRS
jgi:2-(1,2-epoxy-1,2-dihydrophenyl)acetyl-CoA isomerase